MMDTVYSFRFAVVMLILLSGTSLVSGCAVKTNNQGSRSVIASPVPDNLRMIILPGSENSEKSIVFRTNDLIDLDMGDEALASEKTQLQEVQSSIVPAAKIKTDDEVDLVFEAPSK